MTVIPISLSVAASYLTSSAMVATCMEVYLYGMQYIIGSWWYIVMGIISAWIYLPVSYSIRSASSFEFFDRRFNSHIRKLASFIYAVETILHTAMTQYVPALSLSQATGFSVFPVACILSSICFVYTASGGLKAVAWADSFQALLFIVASTVISIVGIVMIGGPAAIWDRGVEGSRMDFFNFDSFLNVRYSTPNLLIGGALMLIHYYLSPSFHQRVASMPTFTTARQVVIWSSVFAGIFMASNSVNGAVVYAYFAGCDPVLAKKGIKSHSTILPYFVKQVSKAVPGLEGLFLSGVIAAGLSWEKRPQENRLSNSHGDRMFLPWVNSKGVLAGSLTSGVFTIYVVLGSQHAKKNKLVRDLPKLLTTAMCLINGTYTTESLNMTTSIGTTGPGMVTESDPTVPQLFKMSVMLYMVPGAVLGLVVSLLISFLTGAQDLATVDREMIVPLMHWVLPRPKGESTADVPLKEYVQVSQIEVEG
ncbi:hypothetical protein GE061_000992 [Apolygus lucorum]|uniref:Uncharacterized protein n=1 Tax=Apolygus lucorum TaxID=248454 RepID=A0A8S9Y8T4_APOLU|nr:hypothetical protein GE061_000992 [Apolygus lucorum]